MALQALVENRQPISPLELIIGNDDIEAPLGKSRFKILAAEDLDTVDVSKLRHKWRMSKSRSAGLSSISSTLHPHLPPWCLALSRKRSRPGVEVTPTCPPMSSIALRTVASPKPIPGYSSTPCSRTNGVNKEPGLPG